jgi:hypothetical protein
LRSVELHDIPLIATRGTFAPLEPERLHGLMTTKQLPVQVQTINEKGWLRPGQRPPMSQPIRQKPAKEVVQMVVY